ncbi:MAG: NHLP family bacteriocin export ABC transporter peptidase/permease/ATPase subunit [Gemmatimonadaceae bacterium]|nr:NHLP family bacteriocin export ABC transporter peptidase/permease/ATPase subunit [Gemmatimonadaceae bacterium]
MGVLPGRQGERPRVVARAKTPTILQMEAVECGAAALAMVLAHHGRWVPLEELRVACGVSRDGSKASNVLKAARTYGLVAKGYKKEPAQLREMPVPMVLHWNFNHFVVFEGFRNGMAHLNDPATGPMTVSEAEFDQSFTGVALTFERGEEFRTGGAAPSLLSALARRLPGAHGALLFILLAGLALVLPGVVTPTFSKVFVDDVLVKGLSDWVKPLLWLMLITAIISGVLVWIQQRYLLRLETKLAIETSGRFFWHVLRLPAAFFTQRYAGDIGNRVTINDRIARLVSSDLATTALNAIVIVFYAVLLFQYDILLAGIGVLTAGLNLLALKYVSRRREDLSRRLLQDRGKLMGTAMGGLQTIETLKATGSESDFFSRWAGYQAKVSNAYQDLQFTSQMLSVVPPCLMALNTAMILGVGGLRVMDGHMSMGLLIAFQSLMSLFITPVNRMMDLGSMAQEVKGDLARLDDVLRASRDPLTGAPATSRTVGEPEEASAPLVPAEARAAGLSSQTKLSGRLELRDVSFGYSVLEPPLIERFSLVLRPGSRVALVGGSGSGKSTVAKLVAGLYEPWEGTIHFDGRSRQEIPRDLLTTSIGVVDQDIAMFEDSIEHNLALWDSTVPEQDLVSAARDACIHEEVAARPSGYQSRMEEGGRNFSGGQRQRMEIARALVNNPSILILDEATSALDPTTEKVIDDNLRRRGCTCLIVAHRLSTIRDCDEIILLDRGRVVQRGTHADLHAVDGPYRRLIASE